jgi:hypothetical protein
VWHGMAGERHAVCESTFNGYCGIFSFTLSEKTLLHCASLVSHIALLYVGNNNMYYSLVMIKVNIFLLLVKHELAPGFVRLFTLVLHMAETCERCDIFTVLF